MAKRKRKTSSPADSGTTTTTGGAGEVPRFEQPDELFPGEWDDAEVIYPREEDREDNRKWTPATPGQILTNINFVLGAVKTFEKLDDAGLEREAGRILAEALSDAADGNLVVECPTGGTAMERLARLKQWLLAADEHAACELDAEAMDVLGVMASAPDRLWLGVEIVAEAPSLERKTTDRRVAYLIRHGLAERPSPRKGARVTPKGLRTYTRNASMER